MDVVISLKIPRKLWVLALFFFGLSAKSNPHNINKVAHVYGMGNPETSFGIGNSIEQLLVARAY
jgi:hypothetical protein